MKKRKMKKTLVAVVSVLLLIATVAGLGTLFGSQTKKIGSSAFSVGGLDDKGEYIEQNYTIFTKELIECQGLEIEPDFMSTSSYRVYLYNSEKKLIEATQELTGNYKLKNTLAQYCRIMIIPEDSTKKDFSISWFEVRGIADDLTIKVNRKQNFKLRDYFVADEANEDKIAVNNDGVLGYTEKSGYGCSEIIEIGGMTGFVVKFPGDNQTEGCEVIFLTMSEDGATYNYVVSNTITGEENVVDLIVPETATHMVVNYNLDDTIVINQAQ